MIDRGSSLSEDDIRNDLTDYYSMLNQSIFQNSSGESLACGEGCSYCCHLHITVKPYELLPIVDHIQKLEAVEKSEVENIMRDNCKLVEEATDENLLLINFTCPFLISDSCSIYSIRPTACRIAHSKRSEICKEAFQFPSQQIKSEHVVSVLESAFEIEEAFENIYGEYRDVSDYNMNMALCEALEQPQWITRFLSGDEVFSDSALNRL